MALILDVSYQEKDQAKALGARWNNDLKKWYVANASDYYKFKEWIVKQGNMIIVNDLYIIEGEVFCWKCKQKTKVIAFGYKDCLNVSEKGIYPPKEIKLHLMAHFSPIPDKIMNYIATKYHYKEKYSNTVERSYLANVCQSCDSLQGDWFLFNEPDSPFFLTSSDKVKALKVYRIPLDYDFIVNDKEVIGGGTKIERNLSPILLEI